MNFTEIIEEILNESQKVKIKNIINGDGNNVYTPGSKTKFSGWYAPKEDTLIMFGYAMHSTFMSNYWPSIRFQNKTKKGREYFIRNTYKKYDKLVAKYGDQIQKAIEKSKGTDADYEDFYGLGWIRINMTHGIINITHDKNADNGDVLNLLRFLKTNYEEKEVTEIRVENGIRTQFRTIENLADIPDKGNDAVSGDELIDKARNHIFGVGDYVSGNKSFTEMVEEILAQLRV